MVTSAPQKRLPNQGLARFHRDLEPIAQIRDGYCGAVMKLTMVVGADSDDVGRAKDPYATSCDTFDVMRLDIGQTVALSEALSRQVERGADLAALTVQHLDDVADRSSLDPSLKFMSDARCGVLVAIQSRLQASEVQRRGAGWDRRDVDFTRPGQISQDDRVLQRALAQRSGEMEGEQDALVPISRPARTRPSPNGALSRR